MFNPLIHIKTLFANINKSGKTDNDVSSQSGEEKNLEMGKDALLLKSILDSKFIEYELSTRLLNALKKANIIFIRDIMGYSKSQLLLLPQMGEKSIRELEEFLSNHNICWPTNGNLSIEDPDLFPEIQKPINNLKLSVNIANKKFQDQNLSARLINALGRSGIYQISDILKYSMQQLSLLPNIGKTSLEELESFLFENGITLGEKYEIVYDEKQDESIPMAKPLKLKKFIIQSLDERMATIVLERYNGNTLEAIARKFGLTRERVRQICNKLKWPKIGALEEDKYKDIFNRYMWDNVDSFCQIFQEDKTCYYYLKLRYGCGKLSLKEFCQEPSLTDEQRRISLTLFQGVLNNAGQVIFRQDFLEKFIKKYAVNKISLEEFVEKYNLEIDKYPELKLKKFTSHTLRGRLLQREDIVWCGNSSFRYYDFNIINRAELEKLLPSIDGFFSSMCIFRENKDLMAAWDIRDKNELHSILKSCIHRDDISFSRMPSFFIGYKDKKAFLLEQAHKFSPITVSELAKVLSDYYGHEEQTMTSILFSELAPYIINDTIDVQTEAISPNEKVLLSQNLTADIYQIDEIKKILISLGMSPQRILRRYVCQQIGYVLYSDFILSTRFGTIGNYLEAKEIISTNDKICGLPTIRQQLINLQKNMQIFKLTEDFWITQKKLETIGVSNQDISHLSETIISLFRNKDFFSVYNVLDEIDYTHFEEKGLAEDFLENILMSIPGVDTLRIFHNRLFSFEFKSVTINWFVRYLIGQYGKITLLDLSKEIARRYQLQVSTDKLKGILSALDDVFYSDILGKIYLDKNDYYEEIYNEK